MKRKMFTAGFLLVLSLTMHAQSNVPEFKNARVMVSPVASITAYAFNLKDVKLLNGARSPWYTCIK